MDNYQEEYDKWEQGWMKECKEQLDKDPNFPLKVTPEQAMLILEPIEAPENFYCDGEISGEEALKNWKEKLRNLGLNPRHVSWCEKYIFG